MPTIFLRLGIFQPAKWGFFNRRKLGNIQPALTDAAALFASVPPKPGFFRKRPCLWWDFPDLLTWPQVHAPVQVIRPLETYSARRQLDGQDDVRTSEWIWVTTLPVQPVSTELAIGFGHQRWDIENHGFNESIKGWHADHIYKHDSKRHRVLSTARLPCRQYLSCVRRAQS
jgi:hypothetical protein